MIHQVRLDVIFPLIMNVLTFLNISKDHNICELFFFIIDNII